MFEPQYVLYEMIFLHIFADYTLQGCLANLKQKDYWKNEGDLYKNDYKTALLEHSFEWSFIILIPFLIKISSLNGFRFDALYIFILLLNTFVHYVVDDAKANEKTINLKTDQIIHLIQIILSWIIYCTI